MVKSLPKKLTLHFKEVMVLVDTGFGSVQFIQGVRKEKYHIIAGIARTRKLIDGRCVTQLHKRGQQLRLQGLKFPVYVSWYYFKRSDGKYEKRFVISTKALKASTISWWGKLRWQIEGWFKTAKHRFGLHRFGESAPFGGFPSVGDCEPEGTRNPFRGLSLVRAVSYFLCFSALGLFIDSDRPGIPT